MYCTYSWHVHRYMHAFNILPGNIWVSFYLLHLSVSDYYFCNSNIGKQPLAHNVFIRQGEKDEQLLLQSSLRQLPKVHILKNFFPPHFLCSINFLDGQGCLFGDRGGQNLSYWGVIAVWILWLLGFCNKSFSFTTRLSSY